MISIAVNIFIFAVYVLILVTEYIFSRIFTFNHNNLWLITTLVYIVFIIYQILVRTNEYLEKGKVSEILNSIIDSVNGIPLINKDGRIIIQWDIIFKKLIDKKLYVLYDKIVKTKTKTIDHYVNQYPSLLFNMDMVERNSKIDTKSVITGKGEISKGETDKPEISEEIRNMLFIKYVSENKVTLANFDSSIYVDVLLNDEYEPPEYEKFGAIPDSRYDGFSVVAFYNNQKYTIVPRTMVFRKRIDKEKWLYRNIDRIKHCVESIIAGEQVHQIIVDELSLTDVATDYIEEDQDKLPELHFECINDNYLIFSGIKNGKETLKAYCVLDTAPNSFEIRLVKYELIDNDAGEVVEDDITVAIGNAYQPLLTIMEKMQFIIENISLAISKKDIHNIVIK